MISAKVIADSRNSNGCRLTSLIVTMPRIVLAEFNTHRMFSRNSASSRAIPFKKMAKSVMENPFIPLAWQVEHKGMQGTEYFTPDAVEYGEFVEQWLAMRDNAVDGATQISEGITASSGIDSGDAPSKETQIGVTKQLCNRLLETFMWHTVIVSATDWEHFFGLRAPIYETKFGTFRSRRDAMESENDVTDRNPNVDLSDLPAYNDITEWLKLNKGFAEIHISLVAEAMWDAMNDSKPRQLEPGEWHVPFGDRYDEEELNKAMGVTPDDVELQEQHREDIKRKIAVARCAGVSYTVAGSDGAPEDYIKLVKRHDMLASSGHWSPFEHVAFANWNNNNYVGNFKGFTQYRKQFQNEYNPA